MCGYNSVSTMPSTRKRARNQTTSRFSPTDAFTWHQVSVAELHSLSAETLQLQLTAKNLVSTGNKSILAQRLYNALRHTEILPSATFMEPTMSVDIQQSTIFVTTSNPPGDQQTRTMQSAVSINTDQDSSLHPQHLANLLLLVASQLSATPINSSLVQHQFPTVMMDPPTTTPPQDDQLSETSTISPPNVPAVIPPSMPPKLLYFLQLPPILLWIQSLHSRDPASSPLDPASCSSTPA